MITCSAGVMAYNEEANIGRLLRALLDQRLSACSLSAITVVASGCTDRTEEIVRGFTQRDPRIRLVVQKKREGKASAVNLFLAGAAGDVCLLISGDVVPDPDTVEKLAAPFADSSVGMTGGRPVPVDSEDTFMGFTVHLLWRLHHRIALRHPKLGEMVAFRNIVRSIPPETAVDEASIEAIVIAAGLRLVYVGDALVRNKGAGNIRDFLTQRRRIAAGHRWLAEGRGYAVATSSAGNILGPLLAQMRWRPREIAWTAGAVLLEAWGRVLGWYDYRVRKRNPFVWDISSSTKNPEGTS